MLLIRYARVRANLHAHLVDARVLEQREIGIEEPAGKGGGGAQHVRRQIKATDVPENERNSLGRNQTPRIGVPLNKVWDYIGG